MKIRKEIDVKLSEYTLNVHAEFYESADEVIEDCRTLPIRHKNYEVDHRCDKEWTGVATYDEALALLRDGYTPVIDAFKSELNKVTAYGPRFAFENNVHGFAPIVPLVLKGIPTCMYNMTMRTIKAKVLDICYDMGITGGFSPEQVLEAGKTVLGAVLELERLGYRINLYAVQRHFDRGEKALDFMCVKVKSSNTPLDLKRMSYPLIHPSFFRVIGFDWQSKSPIARYLGSGRGRAFAPTHSKEDVRKIAHAIFGKQATYISAESLIEEHCDKEKLKEMFTDVHPEK